eukprot:5418229-Amphidinium_carterae.1
MQLIEILLGFNGAQLRTPQSTRDSQTMEQPAEFQLDNSDMKSSFAEFKLLWVGFRRTCLNCITEFA